MMQFIHLCLVLATVQLLLVSAEVIPLPEGVNVIFSLPGSFESCTKHGCGNFVSCVSELNQGSNNMLALDNLVLSDSGSYCCRTSNDDCGLELNVVRGCIKSFLIDVEFTQDHTLEIKGGTTDDCMKACTYDTTCQYFTFIKSKGQCSLMGSKGPLRIKRNSDAISGYSRKRCCTPEFIYQNGSEKPNDVQGSLNLQFHNESKSWFEAFGFCRTQKQTLVQITNDTVMNNVTHLQQNETVTQNGVWVGLERPIFGCDTTWRWISGGSVNTSQWNSSSPPSSTNKYCGKIIWVNETRTIKLLDDDCFNKLPFICQGST
ncbi:uncharacterized protein LOC114868720 isoform X2 [Betta splendens]|uniref:Uncharacterized protein LOC114868720 isoform X2 n=1 Tax=Betta splendens TaxID=158456 RepID=A0A6P7P748_BETSP|nr:uncharacterized protein LOC114868720 isoform X2 [Betta splendens]